MDTANRYVGKILDRRYEIKRIIGIGGMAESGHFGIKSHGNIAGIQFLMGFEQHGQKTMHRIGVGSVHIHQGQGMKSTMHQAVAVNGQESFLHINHLTLQYNTFAGKAKGFSCNKCKKKL